MTYKKDDDGEERQDIIIKVRLTRIELYEYNRRARKYGYYDICSWLKSRVYGQLAHISEKLPFNYEKVFEKLDKILTTTDCFPDELDTVFVNGVPFATTTYGEGTRRLIRDEIAYEMEHFNLSTQEATDKIVAKIRNMPDVQSQYGWLKELCEISEKLPFNHQC